MTTQNKAVTCYLPKDIEGFITGYCNEYGITRKDKEGHIYPSLGTGIIELLKLLAYNPELVGSPLPDTVPSKFSEDAIEKKIDEILEKKLSHLPTNVPSQVTDLDLLARIENMERLLRLQQSASIASPSPSPPARPAIETVTPEVSPSPPGTDAIASIDGTVETVNGDIFPDSPPDRPAIDSSAKGYSKGLTDSELARLLKIDKSNITRWKQRGKPTPKYKDWELIGRLWFNKSPKAD